MALAFIGSLAVTLDAQHLGIIRSGEAIAAQALAPGLGVIRGDTLTRLKDGHSVRVDFDLAVLPGPGGAAAANGRQTFVLSYDLWEERFAVTLAGPPPRSVTHLTANAAESWCLEHVTIPVTALGTLRDAPFWIRLEYRLLDGETAAARDEDAGLTLRGLIEAFSRKPRPSAVAHAVEAGPFRIR
jgi:hypothetical protein